MLDVPIVRLLGREQHYDEVQRLMFIIEDVCKNGISDRVLTYEYPLRYCLDFTDVEGSTVCKECPVTSIVTGHGDKPCIHNQYETALRESGIEIDESMAIMHVCNDTPRKYQGTLVWLAWIASKVTAVFLASLAQQEMNLYNKHPHKHGVRNAFKLFKRLETLQCIVV